MKALSKAMDSLITQTWLIIALSWITFLKGNVLGNNAFNNRWSTATTAAYNLFTGGYENDVIETSLKV